ncbi:ABC transporter substrate-binding protein [Rariglobus hedericola]|uniref:Spermidine/putrescine ABC transporter substrate-binding protein n=1 Tax=Rariglobus hedericola TaxID=2597822 RepID=A0A556QQ69_9BACT|nr:spermidine/putrescine ABC transporter substrate-binding protein [Rariglobus hedericola]TSJ78787.1 spermidine/putrescine ABC transporter substrate-binding protein [Rariglobus hedericola]
MKLLRLLPLFVLAATFAVTGRAADKELNLYAWSEYIPQTVLDGFTKETGIKVNYETFASGEEMLAKLLAGGTRYDLIQPPDYIAEALIKNKLLIPLDYKKLPNFKNILPEFTKMPHDPEQAFTIPYMAGTVGIVVNTEKVKEPVKGYADLFSNKYKGRIVALDDGRELVVGALYTLGIGLNDITSANLEKARPVLAGWFKNIKLFDSDSPKTALLNGDVDLGLVWGGEAAILWNENKKFQYHLPSEGAHMFVDILAIPKGSKNQTAAHKFLDYILRPEVSVLISEEFPYTNPNGEARKQLTPEQLANPASYPKTDRKLDTFRHLGESGALIDELVTDLKNAK